jgi:hypothetical protein
VVGVPIFSGSESAAASYLLESGELVLIFYWRSAIPQFGAQVLGRTTALQIALQDSATVVALHSWPAFPLSFAERSCVSDEDTHVFDSMRSAICCKRHHASAASGVTRLWDRCPSRV